MKKFLLAFAAIAVMVCTAISFTSCGSDDDDDQTVPGENYVIYYFHADYAAADEAFYGDAKKIYQNHVAALSTCTWDEQNHISFKDCQGSSMDATIAKVFYNAESEIQALDRSGITTVTFTVTRTTTNGETTDVQVYKKSFTSK